MLCKMWKDIKIRKSTLAIKFPVLSHNYNSYPTLLLCGKFQGPRCVYGLAYELRRNFNRGTESFSFSLKSNFLDSDKSLDVFYRGLSHNVAYNLLNINNFRILLPNRTNLLSRLSNGVCMHSVSAYIVCGCVFCYISLDCVSFFNIFCFIFQVRDTFDVVI